MLYLWIKWLHILSATLMMGTGLGTAFYKFFTVRSKNLPATVVVLRLVVIADLIFTLPSVILQPVSGWYLVSLGRFSWHSSWLMLSVVAYVLIGLCWLPAFWLQWRMYSMACKALSSGEAISRQFHRYGLIWAVLGFPAFFLMLLIYYYMVFKPA